MALTPNHTARVAVLSVAAILCVTSIFLAWWVVDSEFQGASQQTTARPFHAGDLANDGDEEGLSDQVVVTGILIVLAAVAALAHLGVDLLPVLGRAALPVPRLVAAFLTIGFGLAAVLYTAIVWPEAAGSNLGFFDRLDLSSFGGGSVTTYAGAGWWLALLGTIPMPLASFILSLVERRTATAGP